VLTTSSQHLATRFPATIFHCISRRVWDGDASSKGARETLPIAGASEANIPGIGRAAEGFLTALLRS
jgi:hypothetical protein